ncbi:Zn-dependent exopeptidase [Clavulina sp. PMI_390]|nr:Zn-dependent exopeptidase [Clavulina sp. PMI_390]
MNTTHPFLAHTLRQEESSVLSLAADARHIFSGSQGKDIYVWDRETMQVKKTLRGHSGSVLMLELSEEKEWLFSSSSDSTVRIWSTSSLAPLYVIHPSGETDAGDIYSLTFSYTPADPTVPTSDRAILFFGCQNTSLQWIDLSSAKLLPIFLKPRVKRPPKKPHKFFDSQPRGSQAAVPTLNTLPSSSTGLPRTSSISSIGSLEQPSVRNKGANRRPRVLRVPDTNVVDSAHYGYIYCMTLIPPPKAGPTTKPFGSFEPTQRFESDRNARKDGEIRFVTGSGDEDVKIWSFAPNAADPSPKLLHTFEMPPPTNICPSSEYCGGAVLSVMVRNDCVYAGCQGGLVVVWSLDTSSVVRTLMTKESVDVLSLSIIDTDLYTCLSNGEIQRYSGSFARTATWAGHDGIVLSSIIVPVVAPESLGTTDGGSNDECTPSLTPPQRWTLVTGASDNHIKLWLIERPPSLSAIEPASKPIEAMVEALTEFVGIPSVTASEAHREFCRQAAIWLQGSLSQLGAEASLLPSVVEGKNPLVLATFHGSPRDSTSRKRRVMFYGHYDVIAAPTTTPSSSWKTPPFSLTGVSGYLYGRGVSDNKGPIIAAACAIASLQARQELDCDVVFLIEGEEEAGSGGFADSVRANKDRIGDIDAILLSNSYWIDDKTPCLTYGLRGVVQASLEISSTFSDLHSGVEGGAWNEPMMDMIKLLATLSGPDSKIAIPSFYDAVRPETACERDSFEEIARITGGQPNKIASRWREPSLTVHNMTASTSNNPTIIPSAVKAQVSVRIVPDQDLQTIQNAVQQHLQNSFDASGTTNTLKITIDRTADWWLAELHDGWFTALENSIRDEWGMEPLRIREGGSIPAIPFLEKEFGCHALHLPMGQSSDQAHLQNERISLNNLYKGRSVLERFFRAISSPDFGATP